MQIPCYFAIVGYRSHYGARMLRPGMLVELKKEPENEYDGEAIAVSVVPVGRVGYVANSVRTVPRGCCSAGRIYDTFKESAFGVILFVMQDAAIAELLGDGVVCYSIHRNYVDEEEPSFKP